MMTDWDINFSSLSGGLRSQAILDELARLRALSNVSLVGPVTLTDLSWTPSQQFAIHRDPTKEIWHSGHVNAALMIGDAAIIGTQTGGVWLVDPARRLATPAASHPAVSLSDDWTNPDITCLAFGPDSDLTFFAGCASGGGLYVVELQRTAQGLDLRRTSAMPAPSNSQYAIGSSGDLYAIGVLPRLRRLVVAAANGVWWASMPSSLHQVGLYTWTPAQGLPYQVPATGLAVGPNENVVVALSNGNGIVQGAWTSDPTTTLTFSPSSISGVAVADLQRTSLASCDADRSVMYAIAAATDGSIAAVLRSGDGGANWTATETPDRAAAGTQGFYNICMAVSPYDASLLAVGWQHSCPYVSADGGQTWQQPQPYDNNLHRDWHALTFPRNGDGNKELICGGSDGGFIVSHDLLQTNDSQYNKHLGTIQFYKNYFDASSRFPGLVAGGTQDNGNLYCELNRDPAEWLILEGGDGGNHRFIDAIGALLRTNNELKDASGRNYGAEVRIAFWDRAAHRFNPSGSATTDVVLVDGTNDGLTTTVFDAVAAPAAKRGDETLYACAGKDKTVYALFAKADGTAAHFTHAGSLNENVTAVASYDGHSMLVGTVSGQILTLNPFTGQGLYQPLASTVVGQGAIIRIQMTADRAFALGSNGTLLRWTGTEWKDIVYGMVTFAVHPDTGSTRAFAAWDDRIWVSENNGDNWSQMVSVGLPAYPHISTLKIAGDGKGGHILYLATYGRTVWQAQLDYVRTFKQPQLPSAVSDVLVGLLDDGAGLVRVGNQIFHVPPLPPNDGIAAALADYAEAAMLPRTKQRQARLDALRALQQTVAGAIKRLSK